MKYSIKLSSLVSLKYFLRIEFELKVIEKTHQNFMKLLKSEELLLY